MDMSVAAILGIISALAGTVLSFIFIIPESKRKNLPTIFRFVHDLFNFKFLVLEKVLQALYVLCTLTCIGIGFFMLFSGYDSYWSGYKSYFLEGLLVMVLGPIAVRLAYEGLMMFILLIKNVIAINNKLKNQNEDGETPDAFAPNFKASFTADETPEVPAAPATGSFCTHCGAPVAEGSAFCTACGTPQ